MNIYALIGSSGTGKSYRASMVANERNIEYIIDDGLLIKGNKIIAGVSAKREPSKISAIKRALFMNNAHAAQVKQALKQYKPNSLLILGTSEQMIEKIIKNLDLNPDYEKIYIQDVATEREIRRARRIRDEQGMHVIPVPTFEIKKEFSGYFIDALRIFRKKGKNDRLPLSEKTVVRPTYSYLGRYYISDTAIISLVYYICSGNKWIGRIFKVSIESKKQGIVIKVDLSAVYGVEIPAAVRQLKEDIIRKVEQCTGLNVLFIDITVKSIVVANGHK